MSIFITKKERRILPTFEQKGSPDNVRMGRVEIDNDGCTGCELCVLACPAAALEMSGPKSVRMIGEDAPCIACGDCVPVCHPRVVTISKFLEYDGLYKYVDRGEPTGPRKF
ncbi:MAG: 4Fe-4S binding protein [Pseudomonadales bacterium]|nr:4Fe-4S binding protein [Pseudomonadales bacterium]